MSQTIYVVSAGNKYPHGGPRKAFTEWERAKVYAEALDESGLWTDIEETVLDGGIDD